MATVAAQPITVEEFERMGDALRVELVRGEILELPMPGTKRGVLCVWLACLLQKWVDTHNQGLVFSNDTFILTGENPDTVRGADVGYIRKDRLPATGVPDGTLRVAPDLVIEILSPSDRWPDVYQKVTEYLGIGVKEIWVVDGSKRHVDVFRPGAGPQRYAESDVLTSPDVLPGFSSPVAEMFRNV